MIQYFHYHPILGLQYFSGEDNFILNMDKLSTDNFNIDKYMKHVKQIGISIINSCNPTNTVKNIIHNLYEKT